MSTAEFMSGLTPEQRSALMRELADRMIRSRRALAADQRSKAAAKRRRRAKAKVARAARRRNR